LQAHNDRLQSTAGKGMIDLPEVLFLKIKKAPVLQLMLLKYEIS
jgi:hypothetical protein